MTDKVYREAFERAKTDLALAVAKKTQAEKDAVEATEQVLQLRRTITALAIMCGENVEDSMGLTEAVRAVIGSEWRTFRYIKEQVEQLGVALVDLRNPDASILSVLNRLVATNEFEQNVGKRGSGQTSQDVKIWRKVTPINDDDIPF
jgi:hypothetical protein